MSEELRVTKKDKKEKYIEILPQIKSLIEVEVDNIANLANIAAALRMSFNFFWVGFYVVKGDELVLGPFQGDIACTRIKKGKGVCGAAWEKNKSIIVPNVDEFPGHIACSSLSKSEIVIPVYHQDEVVAILDVDSNKLNDFDATDLEYLRELTTFISWS